MKIVNNPGAWVLFGVIIGAISLAVSALDHGIFPLEGAKLLLLVEPLVVGAVFYLVGVKISKMAAELTAKERRAADSEQSLRTIVDHLDTGICTVDRGLIIDGNFNSEFQRLFGMSDFAGKSILTTLFVTWTEKQRADLQEAVELAFMSTASSDDMINSVLPTRELVTLGAVPGDAKYVHVSLSRILSEGSVEKVMFLFKDVTLARKLKEVEEKHKQILDDQYRRIHQMLKHERSVVFGFFASFSASMDALAGLLKDLTQGQDNAPLLREAVGKVHSIKGEAFSLDFEGCAEKAQAFEAYLREIQHATLDLEHHLTIISNFESLADERRIFERMLGKMADFAGAQVQEKNQRGGFDATELESTLSLVCARSAEEAGRAARLRFTADSGAIPEAVFLPLKEGLIHLVRNSIAHGIETTEERRSRGKAEEGSIDISIKREGSELVLRYTDDGRGFDYDGIRRTIVAKGLKDEAQVQTLSPGELVRFLFRDGFSTKAGVDMVAGQGAGLYVVRNLFVGDLKGNFKVSSSTGRGVLFSLRIPSREKEVSTL